VPTDPLRRLLEKKLHPATVRRLIAEKASKHALTSHQALLAVARDRGITTWTKYAAPEELASLRNLGGAQPTAAPVPVTVTAAPARAAPRRATPRRNGTAEAKGPRDKVFVVHGRNTQVRNGMFAFLRALDLRPVEWGQAVNATAKPMPFIALTLETALSGPNAVVVLMTPDEVVHLKQQFVAKNDPDEERKPMGQPRPNVFFEAGMALARHPEKTIFVIFGRVKSFSDIAGMHTVRLNNTAGKRTDLVEKLRLAGADPQTEGKRDWLNEGDFDFKGEDDADNEAP
jgi:predicted nucleotide-binding protein